MDRLKQEWKGTQIPEEVRLRARNMAWTRMQSPSADRQALRWVAVAATLAAVIALVWLWDGRETHIHQVSAPAAKHASHPTEAVTQMAIPSIKSIQAANLKKITRRVAPMRMNKSQEELERIVLNFRLPESGARIIWIMDSKFHLDGGVE
jgi:hypothetical protein